jgi:hypothetical protein
MNMRLIVLLSITLSFVPTALAKKITTTEGLIQVLQKRYAKSWYKTATFVQKTTNIDKDGKQKVEIWYEALSVPGSLRIDFTPDQGRQRDPLHQWPGLFIQKRQARKHPAVRASLDDSRV